jgi:hypothetical protein
MQMIPEGKKSTFFQVVLTGLIFILAFISGPEIQMFIRFVLADLRSSGELNLDF